MKNISQKLTSLCGAIGLVLVVTSLTALAAEPGVIRISDSKKVAPPAPTSTAPPAPTVTKPVVPPHTPPAPGVSCDLNGGCGTKGCCDVPGNGCGLGCNDTCCKPKPQKRKKQKRCPILDDCCEPNCSGCDSDNCRTKRAKKRKNCPKSCKSCNGRGCRFGGKPQICFDGSCRKPHCSHRKNGICAGCKRAMRRGGYRRGMFKSPRGFYHGNYAGHCSRFRSRNIAYGHAMKWKAASEIDKVGSWFVCKAGYFIPTGGDGTGLPPIGHYSNVYAVEPGYVHMNDRGQLYAAEGHNIPMTVPVAPNVRYQYNYSWGTPTSRLTPISNYRGY